MLSPAADHVLAIEVKGTLRPGVVPRLSRRAVLQMSAAWMDKADNPGMAEWDLQSEDVSGAAVAVNFADMTLRGNGGADSSWRRNAIGLGRSKCGTGNGRRRAGCTLRSSSATPR